jgi:hypothetical protein
VAAVAVIALWLTLPADHPNTDQTNTDVPRRGRDPEPRGEHRKGQHR